MDDAGGVKTRHVAWAFVALLLACLAPGAIYWNSIHAHFARCVYGDPICSLTVSTYLLCILTVAAFLAAYRAARYAQKAFAMERSVILSLDECRAHEDDLAAAQVEEDVLKRATVQRHEPHKREQRFLRIVAKEFFENTRPADFSRERYGRVDFDCTSMGRSPLINGQLPVIWIAADGAHGRLRLDIGSIPTGTFVHLTLWLAKDLNRTSFSWGGKAIHRPSSDEPQEVDFNDREFGISVFASAKGENPHEVDSGQKVRLE
jgi:hypothetical protein